MKTVKIPFFYPSISLANPRIAHMGFFEMVQTARSKHEPFAQPPDERVCTNTGFSVFFKEFAPRMIPVRPTGKGRTYFAKNPYFLRGKKRLTCHLQRTHYMIQTADPAIGDRRRDYVCRFPAELYFEGQLSPTRIKTLQSMSGLDQHRPQFRIAGPNQARVGLPLAAGGVARRQTAKPRQLLARAETGKMADFRAGLPR